MNEPTNEWTEADKVYETNKREREPETKDAAYANDKQRDGYARARDIDEQFGALTTAIYAVVIDVNADKTGMDNVKMRLGECRRLAGEALGLLQPVPPQKHAFLDENRPNRQTQPPAPPPR